MIKEDLTIHPFSLKQIIENFDKIADKTGKFGEPSNELSKEEKKKLYELMRKFNSYGQSLRGDQAIMETAKTLSEAAALAKKFALAENNADFLQKETITRDFGQVDKITGQIQKLSKECVSRMMQLNALYEDVGHVYERYFEMENLNEDVETEEPPVVDPDIAPPPTTPAPEKPGNPLLPRPNIRPRPKAEECGNCGCKNPDDTHGFPIPPEEQEEYASSF